MAEQQHAGYACDQGEAGEHRRQRAARHIRQRVLGTPGNEASAGGEPARGQSLPSGTRVPEEGEPDRHHPRLQDSEHPESRRGRRRERDQPGQPGHAQHDQVVPDQGPVRRGPRLRGAGLHSGHPRSRVAVSRLARIRRGSEELPRGSGSAARHGRHAVRSARWNDHERRRFDREADLPFRTCRWTAPATASTCPAARS